MASPTKGIVLNADVAIASALRKKGCQGCSGAAIGVSLARDLRPGQRGVKVSPS